MGKEDFVCPICGNRDPRYIGMRGGSPYCRKCVAFHGEKAASVVHHPQAVELVLHYSLSEEQLTLSKKIVSNYVHGIDTLVYAVCGSGKTEISYGVISYALSLGFQVGFALPRKRFSLKRFSRSFWRTKR